MELITGLLLLGLVASVLWLPAWWFSGQMDDRLAQSLSRIPVSIGVALVAYLTFVNLLGKLLENSQQAVIFYLMINLAFCAVLLWKHRPELNMSFVWQKKKSWLGIVLIAAFLAIPQWFQAVSGNRWDEVASSAIHITAPNQFAEGVFPPRHNAFPDIPIKYHYGFTLLSGTVHWLTGLSSNISIDIVSTGIWLFIFLFLFAWMRQLGISKIASVWGGFAALLGGGFSWMYLTSLRVYDGYQKLPPDSTLIHSFDPGIGWWDNLLTVMKYQNIHLINAEGKKFPLPFDIAIHYQQHSVAIGIALTLVAAYVFWLWQTRRTNSPIMLVVNILCFGLVFLGHAVFGSVASVSAGLALLVFWIREPSWNRIFSGALFTIGVTAFAFLHGGMLSTGDEYGPPGAPIAIRNTFGYISGNFVDQVNWNLAGFGLLLIFTILTLWIWLLQQQVSRQKNVFLVFFLLFVLVSFMIPQLLYFSHAGGIEEQTEISKFFFCTHLSLAILSVLAVDYLAKKFSWWAILPFFAVTAVSPLAVSIAGAQNDSGEWAGFYESPYGWQGGKNYKAAGEAFRSLKRSNRDQYYDFSTEESRSRYLNELLIYGGSVFTLSPTRYEVTGFGFLIAENQVADRILHESKMARLLPGAAESSGTDWLYTISSQDLLPRPVVVRSRFSKMVTEGMLVKRFSAGSRELYEFKAETLTLDHGLENYWTPKVISQAHSDWDGDGKIDLLFFDYEKKAIIFNKEKISLAGQLESANDFPLVFLARFSDDSRVDLLLGDMADAVFQRGKLVSGMIRQYPFNWRRFDSKTNQWGKAYPYGSWSRPVGIPMVADLDNDGLDSQLSFGPGSGVWSIFPNRRIRGPSLPASTRPLPVVGRFLPGSSKNLAVWSPVTGHFKVQNSTDGETVSMTWGGRAGDILMPGDFDGDGVDEIGLWQPHNNTWWIRNMPSGPNLSYTFGSSTSIPIPADYDNDGRLDLAYWEPAKNEIYVSYDFGKSIGRTISVPPHSIPVFVHMY
ncbi:FG-GAP repeat domain-containing protein [Pseudomonadota bacterium]